MLLSVIHIFKWYTTGENLLIIIIGLIYSVGVIFAVIDGFKRLFAGEFKILLINTAAVIGYILFGSFLFFGALSSITTTPIYESTKGDYSKYIEYRKDIIDEGRSFSPAKKDSITISGITFDLSKQTFSENVGLNNRIELEGLYEKGSDRISVTFSLNWHTKHNDELKCDLIISSSVDDTGYYHVNYKIPMSYNGSFSDVTILEENKTINRNTLNEYIIEMTRVCGNIFVECCSSKYFLSLVDYDNGYFSSVKTIKERPRGIDRVGTYDDLTVERIKVNDFTQKYYDIVIINDFYSGNDKVDYKYDEHNKYTVITLSNSGSIKDEIYLSMIIPNNPDFNKPIECMYTYSVKEDSRYKYTFFHSTFGYTFSFPWNGTNSLDIMNVENLGDYQLEEDDTFFYSLLDEALLLIRYYYSQTIYEKYGIKLDDDRIGYFNYSEEIPEIDSSRNYREQNKTYNITFETNGGTLNNPPKTFVPIKDISLPVPTKTKNGFICSFDGWYLENDFKTNVRSLKEYTRDLKLYAKYIETPLFYDINYHLNGGHFESSADEVTKFQSYTGDFVLKNPVREGYKFLGWSLSYNYGDYITSFSTERNTRIDLYAMFIKVNKLSFDLDGGTSDSDLLNITSWDKNLYINLSLINPVKPGYDLDSYILEIDGTDRYYKFNKNFIIDFSVLDDHDYTLKAIYKEKEGLSIKTNSKDVDDFFVYLGEPTNKFITPTKDGAKVIGYYYDEYLTNKCNYLEIEGDYTIFNRAGFNNSSCTLYCLWDKVELSFETNDSEHKMDSVLVSTSDYIYPNTYKIDFEPVGMRFSSWFFDNDFSKIFNEPTIFKKDTTLYANYEEPYKITVHYQDGEDTDTLYIYRGSKIEKIDKEWPVDIKFYGWYTDESFDNRFYINDTKVYSDLDLYPKLAKLHKVTVKFNNGDDDIVKYIEDGKTLGNIEVKTNIEGKFYHKYSIEGKTGSYDPYTYQIKEDTVMSLNWYDNLDIKGTYYGFYFSTNSYSGSYTLDPNDSSSYFYYKIDEIGNVTTDIKAMGSLFDYFEDRILKVNDNNGTIEYEYSKLAHYIEYDGYEFIVIGRNSTYPQIINPTKSSGIMCLVKLDNINTQQLSMKLNNYNLPMTIEIKINGSIYYLTANSCTTYTPSSSVLFIEKK